MLNEAAIAVQLFKIAKAKPLSFPRGQLGLQGLAVAAHMIERNEISLGTSGNGPVPRCAAFVASSTSAGV